MTERGKRFKIASTNSRPRDIRLRTEQLNFPKV
jgi:hypothetical protein